MRHVVLAKILLLAVFAGVPIVARADTVELTTGERIDGKDARAGGDHVTIAVGTQVLVLQRDQVRALYLGPTAPPCSPATPKP